MNNSIIELVNHFYELLGDISVEEIVSNNQLMDKAQEIKDIYLKVQSSGAKI